MVSFNDLFSTDNDPGDQSEIWDIGGNYNADLAGMSLALSAGYQERSLEVPAAGFEDRSEWAVHGTLGSGPFKAGAGYREDNKGSCPVKTPT